MNVLSTPPPVALDIPEVVVRLVPARVSLEGMRSQRSGEGAAKTYDALIYADQPLFGEEESPPVLPRGEPEFVVGLPLLAVGQVRIRWSHYREFLDAFQEGEKAAYLMRERLLETLSGGLKALFRGELTTDALLRIWWSVQSPELFDLPWELAAVGEANQRNSQLSFVRGTPGEWAPPVPLQGPMRLAVIGSGAPPDLEGALAALPPTIQVEWLEGDPRLALQQAVRSDCELVHLIADGLYTQGTEGILNFGEPVMSAAYTQAPPAQGAFQPSQRDQITAAELSSLVRGSRITLLGLSTRTPDLALLTEAGEAITTEDGASLLTGMVPQVYRAFAYLGHSHLPLPNIVAQLGPMQGYPLGAFWHAFYRDLGDSLSVEAAMMAGRKAGPAMPLALFLRDRLRRQFRHLATSRATANPQIVAHSNGIASEFQIAREVLEQLRAVDAKYAESSNNITSSTSYNEASARLDQIEADLVDLAKE
jgi:hypothetical protein